jgi:hypothetical protein
VTASDLLTLARWSEIMIQFLEYRCESIMAQSLDDRSEG